MSEMPHSVCCSERDYSERDYSEKSAGNNYNNFLNLELIFILQDSKIILNTWKKFFLSRLRGHAIL